MGAVAALVVALQTIVPGPPQPAAPELQLKDAQGKRHDLEDYRGKVVLVNFWASWCDPCMDELPAMEKLRVQLAGKPFVILAVQAGGSMRIAQDVASQLKLRFPLLLDRDTSATQRWEVQTLPATFVVGPDGTVVAKHAGEWTLQEMRVAVEAALRQSPR